MIDSELNFSKHIHMVSKKANGIMAVVKRTFTCLDCECFNLLYKSLVRTPWIWRYTTWFPYKMKDIETIGKIQKRAIKQVKQIRHLSYSERLKRLNLPTLRYRRHRGDMIDRPVNCSYQCRKAGKICSIAIRTISRKTDLGTCFLSSSSSSSSS